MRFILFFTVFTAAAYSLIPYKTPWNLLPFHFGLAVLAGGGVALLLRISRFRLVKLVVLAALVPGFVKLAVQSYRANFELPADPANPYVYAQTSPALLRLVGEVEKAAASAPEKGDLFIEVVAPPEETWPLPWYFRGYTRVGYWTSPEAARSDVGTTRAAVVVSSAAFADEIGAELGEGYRQTFYGLRPEVVLALFVRR
jgi:predicted membrane-bound mannosyltransferase